MSFPGLIITGILLLVLIGVSFWPLFFRRKIAQTAILTRQRERALTYYERILTNVRDLDEDLATGKIAESEHEVEREVWMQRGMRLLKMLDELDEQHLLTDVATTDDAAIDAAIEQAIAAASNRQQ